MILSCSCLSFKSAISKHVSITHAIEVLLLSAHLGDRTNLSIGLLVFMVAAVWIRIASVRCLLQFHGATDILHTLVLACLNFMAL